MNNISSKHNRQSTRLFGYDYSYPGFYFITICTNKHKHLFGKIIDGKMYLNDLGKSADLCWSEIPKHFSNTNLHE